ncbi:unnamed protein product [Clavelina lepadiformis]|uniref:SGF29 C-terminal domain-containing protein n=1 Tax=Clavelina lepadiformis TaxID=159417 RepID=A0ABP0F8C8_CLALP
MRRSKQQSGLDNHSSSSGSSKVSPQSVKGSAQSSMADCEQKIQQLLRELYETIIATQTERDKGSVNLDAIRKTHEKMLGELKVSTYYKQKLRNLYSSALSDADAECDLLRKGLEVIAAIKALQEEKRISVRLSSQNPNDEPPRKSMRRGVLMSLLQKSAQTLPLWIGKPNEKIPHLCGALIAGPDYIAKPGDKVAARVKTEEVEEQWILAEVVLFNPVTLKYEVDDIDEEGREHHILSKRRVIPLPQWKANPETDPQALHPKGTLVIALYPQTTCFYRAVINEQPATAHDEYSVLFEDNSYADGYSPALNVAQKYIVVPKEMRESKHQYDEEKFKDDQIEQDGGGPDEQEVSQLLLSGKNSPALKASLQNPPYRSKDASVKDSSTLLVIRVLSSIKSNEISNALNTLSADELDALMKYIYKGFSMGLDGQQCGYLLTWHEKVAAKGGMGCIIRVLSDRKRL